APADALVVGGVHGISALQAAREGGAVRVPAGHSRRLGESRCTVRRWTPCTHLDQIGDVGPGASVCETCVTMGGAWLNLRQCLICGRTGCCDSSPNKHATAHFHETGHPLMRTLEERQSWAWCYVCKETIRQDEGG